MNTRTEFVSALILTLACASPLASASALSSGAAVGSVEPVAGPVAGVANQLTLEQATALAVRDNPNLAEMQARHDAMAAIPSQVGTRPDPVLSGNALNFPTDTFHVGQEPMTQLQLGLTQMFPFPGKLALREAASAYEADAARYTVAETRLRLISEVRSSWWALHYLDRAIEIVARNQELLRQFVQVAKTKYEVGEGIQQDVLLAQLELSKLLDQSIQLAGLRRSETARLNRLLDQPADTGLQLAQPVSTDLPPLASYETLVARASEFRPRLDEKRNEISAAQSRLDLARKDYYPDFMVGAAYGARSGENPESIGGNRADFLSVRVSVNLPIYQTRKRAQAVSQRSSELDRRRHALRAEANTMRAEIATASAEYEQAREQLSLFETGIIPQARQTVASMLAGYQVSEVDFLNLVRSQLTLTNYETLYWRALTMANQARARVQAAVGEDGLRE
jgi:cobalt-zinc-cadmium efflux system outer membrane protein